MPEDKPKFGGDRYYNTPPEKMTLDMCAGHGSDHKAYGWYPKTDPRWSDEQREAYINAFKTYTEIEETEE